MTGKECSRCGRKLKSAKQVYMEGTKHITNTFFDRTSTTELARMFEPPHDPSYRLSMSYELAVRGAICLLLAAPFFILALVGMKYLTPIFFMKVKFWFVNT